MALTCPLGWAVVARLCFLPCPLSSTGHSALVSPCCPCLPALGAPHFPWGPPTECIPCPSCSTPALVLRPWPVPLTYRPPVQGRSQQGPSWPPFSSPPCQIAQASWAGEDVEPGRETEARGLDPMQVTLRCLVRSAVPGLEGLTVSTRSLGSREPGRVRAGVDPRAVTSQPRGH